MGISSIRANSIETELAFARGEPHSDSQLPISETAMRLLRIQEVIRLTGLSRMTIYRFERSGNFPKLRQIGKNTVRWLDEDIDAWMMSRPAAGFSAMSQKQTNPRAPLSRR